MRSLLVALVALLMAPAVVVAQTPVGDGPTIERGEGAVRYVWRNGTSDRLLDDSRAPTPFAPVSVTAGNHDGEMLVAIELRNMGDAGVHAPDLQFTASRGDASFGTVTLLGLPSWVPGGGSVYFFDAHAYDGAVLVGDWDNLTLAAQPPAFPRADASHDDLHLDFMQRRIVNTGSAPIGPVYFQSVVRDEDGVYIGHCSGGVEIPQVPASEGVRIPSKITTDLTDGVMCLNVMAAETVTEMLDSGAPRGGEWILIIISG